MNHTQTLDHEAKMLRRFQQEGKHLAHICMDWDGLAIHGDSDEIIACCCDFELESDNILRDELAKERNEEAMANFNDMWENDPLNFSTDGAPAHSGTELDLKTEVTLVCMLVSNPGNNERPVGWQKRVNDLLRKMLDRIEELESK
jgi:hypothetical protein